MDISPDELFTIIGTKEAELYAMRKRLAELEHLLEQAKKALLQTVQKEPG